MATRLGRLLRLPGSAPVRSFRVTALLVPERIPAGSSAEQAVAALRRALLALPGARHADVQARPFLGRDEAWLAVAPDEAGETPAGRAWARLLARAEVAALEGLAELEGLPAPGVPVPGTPAPGAPAPGRPAAGVPVPGMPTPRMPAPGVVPAATGFAEASAGLGAPGAVRPPRARRAGTAEAEPAQGDAAPPDALALLEQLASRAAPAPAAAPGPAGARQGWSDQALLTRLLSLAGRREEDHAGLAAQLLARHGSFATVLALPPRELLAEPGVNRHTAANIKLVHAAALRFARAEISQAPVLDDRAALLAYLTAVLARERIEQFRILFLDAGHRLLADEAQARGTVNHTPVYPREVARRALELHASSLILVHNHPSGDPSPSREDVGMTELVRRALGVVDVMLQDHLIVGSGRHFSFREAGLL